MTIRVLTEASGSLTSAYLLKAIREAGYVSVASDVDPNCAGRYLADDFILMPYKNDSELWKKITELLVEHKVDVVIPSLDETLIGWAERKKEMDELGIKVLISEKETLKIFQDKWFTYQFFIEEGIPTPETSLKQIYPLVKPREGRGSSGVRITQDNIDMDGMVSQEVVSGTEYTVDVFCDNMNRPVYIVPRRRLGIKEGKSTGGVVEYLLQISDWVDKICNHIPLLGPVNMQCFLCNDGAIKFIEINPRIAGGMALGFAATENWIKLMVDHLVYNKGFVPKPVKYGMEMKRYYAEVFVSPN